MAAARVRFLHKKCRNSFYPRSDNIKRFPVPEEKVNWNVKWDEYSPIEFTSPAVRNQSWADPDISDHDFNPAWNCLEEKINRTSFDGKYEVVNSYPLNIYGRTGIKGRGVLGRWGPNHAADPIVTRWKRNHSTTKLDNDSKLPILQFVAIKRRDSGEWAIPGGMVDPGEVVTATLKREFLEETLNVLERSSNIEANINQGLVDFFSKGNVIYKGYVDDPRNTDNAWIETVAMHFHDGDGTSVGALPFCAGDDAVSVKWLDLNKNLKLYASHFSFIKEVAIQMNCNW